MAGIEEELGRRSKAVEIESVVVGEQDYGVGACCLVGRGIDPIDPGVDGVFFDVGVCRHDFCTESQEAISDEKSGRLSGVAGVALVRQTQEEDSTAVDRLPAEV